MTSLKAQQQWFQYYSEWEINSKWSLLSDASFRWKGVFEDRSQYLIRSGIAYRMKNRFRLAGGMAVSRTFKEYASAFEIRPYQEVQHSYSLPKWDLNQRIRIEERFFEPLNNTMPASSNFNWRFRYAISASISVLQLSKSHPEKKLLLGLGNEIMFNAGAGKGKRPFDQNRLMISPTLAFNQQLSVSFTMMYLHLHDYTNKSYRNKGIFWLQVRHHFGKKPDSK